MALLGKTILITGAARRIGRHLALSLARAGADIVLHYGGSAAEAEQAAQEIRGLGRQAWLMPLDLRDFQALPGLVEQAFQFSGKLYAIINNASVFEPLSFQDTALADWQRALDTNLTAPFLLSQAFAHRLPANAEGRILNLLDWRALRPGADHFAYTISKAALAALTRSMAQALAPRITVNGIAFGAILPPSDGGDPHGILKLVPAQRWASLDEVTQTVQFLLDGPSYITGEIIHLDGGRHLV